MRFASTGEQMYLHKQQLRIPDDGPVPWHVSTSVCSSLSSSICLSLSLSVCLSLSLSLSLSLCLSLSLFLCLCLPYNPFPSLSSFTSYPLRGIRQYHMQEEGVGGGPQKLVRKRRKIIFLSIDRQGSNLFITYDPSRTYSSGNSVRVQFRGCTDSLIQ